MEGETFYQETSFHEFQSTGIQILSGQNSSLEKQTLRDALTRFESLIKTPAVKTAVFQELLQRGY
jgi:hypothetical protein